MGSLDELNSWLGYARVEADKLKTGSAGWRIDVAAVLKNTQNSLFIAQAEAAASGFGYEKSPKITEEKTKYFEGVIVEIDKVVPKIEKFIVVGGTELSARLDVGRAIARRVERQAKKYVPEDSNKNLTPEMLKFLNRLSSILFALARYVNFVSGVKEENPSYD
ncbi:MAG: Cob(I)yrinic acid a,c-diamide adenosyltransferase [Candidatus Jorgensenbacteria bacterium GW2011_GWC1_48_8]|uniref:Corrinoid adenosyltransferase n=1 Tax=Candidatus Jorgensenbacteria bacterium GW2011_GWC1_48_8 TaxID=1618666 RepID=A0A0G1X8S7_9BACT|nr:MAG: Cob(I)yrinic acid a,c-diamide adenosyltransferase [Candidatus Jorgensenbacteria bacterium GW2011_GWC1_48_8]